MGRKIMISSKMFVSPYSNQRMQLITTEPSVTGTSVR